MREIAAVVAATAESRGIGYQGQLVRIKNCSSSFSSFLDWTMISVQIADGDVIFSSFSDPYEINVRNGWILENSHGSYLRI
jgi:hypothetical protein